jgi:hypothetical protein
LFLSGYSADAALPASDRTGGIEHLDKPFSTEQLASKVAGLLEERRAGSTEPQPAHHRAHGPARIA